MTASRRSRGPVAAISAVAGILAGILGGWLAGHWLWGAACAFLVLLAVVAGAESLKACREDAPGDRTAALIVGHGGAVSNSVVATGDVDQSRTTNIRGGAVAALLAILALGGSAGGTLYYAYQPAGLLSGSGGSGPGRPEPAAVLAAAGGHGSPAEAVSGFFGNAFLGDWGKACGYLLPGEQGGCRQQAGGLGVFSGPVGVGRVVVSGARALVVLVGRLCVPAGVAASSPQCASNSNPSAGLGPNISFTAAFDEALNPGPNPPPLIVCEESGGAWYTRG